MIDHGSLRGRDEVPLNHRGNLLRQVFCITGLAKIQMGENDVRRRPHVGRRGNLLGEEARLGQLPQSVGLFDSRSNRGRFCPCGNRLGGGKTSEKGERVREFESFDRGGRFGSHWRSRAQFLESREPGLRVRQGRPLGMCRLPGCHFLGGMLRDSKDGLARIRSCHGGRAEPFEDALAPQHHVARERAKVCRPLGRPGFNGLRIARSHKDQVLAGTCHGDVEHAQFLGQ